METTKFIDISRLSNDLYWALENGEIKESYSFLELYHLLRAEGLRPDDEQGIVHLQSQLARAR